MYVVIITGAIGSGKSEATRYLASLGARTISLDEISHDLLENDVEMREELVGAFGDGILDADGAIVSSKLAQEAFTDDIALEKLDAITHPRIRERAVRIINQVETPCIPTDHDADVLVLEVPLPEHAEDLLAIADEVIVIYSANELRVDRLAARGLGWHDIADRMGHQLTQDAFKAYGDTLIPNDGSVAELHARLDAWWAVHSLSGWKGQRD